MSLSMHFFPWRAAERRPAPRPALPDWVTARLDAPVHDEAAAPQPGCGWFDSSHELHAGLQVTEHLTPQAVANEVPLGWWLDWQTLGERPCRPYTG